MVDNLACGELHPCPKPTSVTWRVYLPTRWARDDKGHLFYNVTGEWRRAAKGL